MTDKQALRLTAEKAKENFMPNFMVPTRDVLALLDELEAAQKRVAELEHSETQLIGERDDAESALNDAYKAVLGQAPEWSNWFSFESAIEEIELVCELWRNQTEDVIQFRQRIAELQSSHSKLRDTLATIHNTIRLDGGYTPLAAILNAARCAYEESATAAGIGKGE